MIVGGFFLSVDSFMYVVAVVDKGEERKFGSGRREKGRRKGVKKEGGMEEWKEIGFCTTTTYYCYYYILLLIPPHCLLATYYYYNYLYFAYTRYANFRAGHQMGYGTYIIYSSRWSSSSSSSIS